MRALGRGKRWLFKRAWANCSPERKQELSKLLRQNGKLARAYRLVEQLRDVLHAPNETTMFSWSPCARPESTHACSSTKQ